jgi:hypothetical protein
MVVEGALVPAMEALGVEMKMLWVRVTEDLPVSVTQF